jgi:hypothetical protein
VAAHTRTRKLWGKSKTRFRNAIQNFSSICHLFSFRFLLRNVGHRGDGGALRPRCTGQFSFWLWLTVCVSWTSTTSAAYVAWQPRCVALRLMACRCRSTSAARVILGCLLAAVHHHFLSFRRAHHACDAASSFEIDSSPAVLCAGCEYDGAVHQQSA